MIAIFDHTKGDTVPRLSYVAEKGGQLWFVRDISTATGRISQPSHHWGCHRPLTILSRQKTQRPSHRWRGMTGLVGVQVSLCFLLSHFAFTLPSLCFSFAFHQFASLQCAFFPSICFLSFRLLSFLPFAFLSVCSLFFLLFSFFLSDCLSVFSVFFGLYVLFLAFFFCSSFMI